MDMARRESPAAWTYVSGLVAAREGRLLTHDAFRQLVAEPEPGALLQRLSGTALEDRVPDAAAVRHLDRIAAETLADCAAELRAVSPSDLATFHVDVQHAFDGLRRFVADRRAEPDRGASGRKAPEADDLWTRVWDDLPADVPEYVRRGVQRVRAVLPTAADRPELLDAVIDAECLDALAREAERRGNDFITGYWRRSRAILGVESLWRARLLEHKPDVQQAVAAELPDAGLAGALTRADLADWPDLLGGAVAGVAPSRLRDLDGATRVRGFVRQAEEGLAEYLRGARSVAFGPERVFAYAIGMHTEVFNLKLVLGGRWAGVAPELLLERLRPGYV